MTIDRIGYVDPIQPGKKAGEANQVRETHRADSISISSEAVAKSEHYWARDLVATAPDLRMDRIEEVKAKINDPAYLNKEVIAATADRLIDMLLG